MSKKDEALKLALDWFEKDGEPDHHPVVDAIREALAEQPAQQQEPPLFPTMLRKMWSGGEVQKWINSNWAASPPQRKPLTDEQQIAEALAKQPAQQQEPAAYELEKLQNAAFHNGPYGFGTPENVAFVKGARWAKEVAEQPAHHQEPVAWFDNDGKLHGRVSIEQLEQLCLNALPPQRKPLTVAEVWDAYMEISADFDCDLIDLADFARAIEAAHGIK